MDEDTKNNTLAGIGTLNERTLHAYLKAHYQPDRSKQEIKIGRYVADIADGSSITEIQTGSFSSLKAKLAAFLKAYDVTIVYPVAQIKRIIWVDPETGEAAPPRRSPKAASGMEIFRELIYIKPWLCTPNLKFRIVLLELDEYRFLNGWSRDRKKGSSRKDRVPAAILGEIVVDCTEDYANLLPASLPSLFTVAELMKCARISRRHAQCAVNVLMAVGAICRVGKDGRAYLYEKTALPSAGIRINPENAAKTEESMG